MLITQPNPKLYQSLTSELQSISIKRTESLLLNIVRANVITQYASKAVPLAKFRGAISEHGTSSDEVLVRDFRRWVPLSDYDVYKPFMTVFDKNPCKESELENLFAPGLPLFLAMSSATSGRSPKLFPRYRQSITVSDFPGLTAAVIFYGYREVKEVERGPGQIVKRFPVSIGSGGSMRVMYGWTNIDDDESRMPLIMPGFVAPWAASMIKHHKSFLMIHALFALACGDLGCIYTTCSTLFYDMMQHIDENWDIFLSSIREGTIPDLPGVNEVRSHLQAPLSASPKRAVELLEIGPPFLCEGWVTRVWPKLSLIVMKCSGPFATVLPKIRSVIGPTVTIRTPGYISSESFVAGPHQADDLHTFVLRSYDLVEFLDITTEESHENLRQTWELEVGKRYEIVLTTNNGLWRYRLGDVVEILGFDVDTGSPVFMISGRRGSTIRFPFILVTDDHIMPAIRAISPDIMQTNEFTTVLDDRQSTQTVGFFVELAGPLGPNAHLAPSRLAEGLIGVNTKFQMLFETAEIRYPTVRIVRPGTFSEYRQWRAEVMSVGPGQVKVPVILPNATSIQWILERVVEEL